MTAAAGNQLVVGLGKTGLSIARFLKGRNEKAIFFDSRKEPPGKEALQKIFPNAAVRRTDSRMPPNVVRLIMSPGVPDRDPLVQKALKKKLEVVSDIEVFARSVEQPFVAITGSNGKSTVTTLVYHMCRADGRAAIAGGNLGEPALDLLQREHAELFVLELSSFQLHRTHKLPAAVAVLLNVSTDHLDWHRDEAEYRAAKYRVFRDALTAVASRDDETAVRHASRCRNFATFGLDEPAAGHFGRRRVDDETYLAYGDTLLLSVRELALYGLHNQLNALAALATGRLLGLDMRSMLQVLVEFPGLAHRMQFVARVASVDYINDSKATNVAAAIASIRSVETPLVLIAGGDGKGGDFSELSAALGDRLRCAVLIGQDAEKIARALDTVMPVHFAESLASAVRIAAANAESGDTVLLAPACASFDQFSSYTERGDVFCEAVRGLQR